MHYGVKIGFLSAYRNGEEDNRLFVSSQEVGIIPDALFDFQLRHVERLVLKVCTSVRMIISLLRDLPKYFSFML